jgi:hypothetical protein
MEPGILRLSRKIQASLPEPAFSLNVRCLRQLPLLLLLLLLLIRVSAV